MSKDLDITKHILVPKHVKLSKEEVKELLEKYNISLKQLPTIFVKDPAIKNLNPEIGEVIKIIRKDDRGEAMYYRVVIYG